MYSLWGCVNIVIDMTALREGILRKRSPNPQFRGTFVNMLEWPNMETASEKDMPFSYNVRKYRRWLPVGREATIELSF